MSHDSSPSLKREFDHVLSSPSIADDDSTSLIDQFYANCSLRDQLENTKNSLLPLHNNEQLKVVEDQSTVVLLESMQNHVMVLKIQDKLFYTTRRTLMGQTSQTTNIPEDARSISNFAPSKSNIQGPVIVQELTKEMGIFTMCDSDELLYVDAGENLFQTMQSQLKVYDGSEGSVNNQFVDRNPVAFEFILDHLRMGGKVKCLGIDKFNLGQLKDILEEAIFFKMDKLAHHIQVLLKSHHNSEVLECETNSVMKPRITNASIEKGIELIEEESKGKDQIIHQLSYEIAKKYKEFLLDANKEDEFYESVDLVVKLNVSGQKFNIPFRVLSQYEQFIITRYIQSPTFKVGLDGHVFIDRNPEFFSLIYSYMICGGKFNHFPASMSTAKRAQFKKEALFYGLNTLLDEYLDELRYPIELLSLENIQMKERDDCLRKFFVKHRDSHILDDKYLTLSPIFEKLDEIRSADRFKIDFVKCPKILELTNKLKYSRHIEKPKLVNSLETFKKNWFNFTHGLLEGLDWNNIFAAGGGVLGCLLKPDEYDTEGTTIMTEFMPVGTSGGHYDKFSILERKNLSFDLDETDFKYWKASNTRVDMNKLKIEKNLYHQFSSISNGSGTLDYYNRGYSGLEWVRKKVADTKDHYKHQRSKSRNPKQGPVKQESNDLDTSEAKYIPDPDIPASFHKSDIDLFLFAVNEEEAEEKITEIYHTIKRNLRKRLVRELPGQYDNFYSNGSSVRSDGVTEVREIVDDDVIIMRTKHAVTFYGYKTRPIQVVLRIYKSPAEVLLSFDIDSASVGYDGNTVWSTDRCRRSLAHGVNLVDVDRQSTTYEYRLYKYAKRGFSVSIPGYHHSKVKNELLHYPRTHIFSSIQKNLRGLARLLMFEFACTSKNPKHILASYDNPQSVNAHVAEEKWAKDFLYDQDSRPSDYFSIALIKTNRYRPKRIYDSIQKARKVYNEKLTYTYQKSHFFICTFNNIEDNFSYEQEPPCIHVPSKIEFITVEPGSQTPIGSFHPVTDNFYKIAYTKFNPYLNKSVNSIIWMKSTFEDRSKEGDSEKKNYRTKDDLIAKYMLITTVQRKSIWFETYTPEISARIEHAFRTFLCFNTNSSEFNVDDNETIDFYTWSVRYGPYHPIYPNQSSILFRETDSYFDESSTNSESSSTTTTTNAINTEEAKPITAKRVSMHSYY